MNSPKKGEAGSAPHHNISDAKLRDLGAGVVVHVQTALKAPDFIR